MKRRIITALISLALLVSCAPTPKFARDISTGIEKEHPESNMSVDRAMSPESDPRRNLSVKMNSAWLGNKPQPYKEDQKLPEVFSKKITMRFPEKSSISTIAERITRVAKVPVRVMPDIYMPASAFANSVTAAATPTTPSGGAPVTPPSVNTGLSGASAGPTGNFETDLSLSYTGAIHGLLDTIAARAGINWEYRDGSIYLFRLVTKTFTLKAVPGKTDLSTQIGKDTSVSSGATGGSSGGSPTSGTFQTNTTTKSQIQLSIWDNIEQSIRVMLTPTGKVSISQATGTITVTDLKEVVDRVNDLIEKENRMASRRVVIGVQVVSFTQNDGEGYGIDWDAVYRHIGDTAGKSWQMGFGSVASLLPADAASLGFTVLSNDSNNPRRLEGSSVFLKALSSMGRVKVTHRTPITTTHNQPSAYAVTIQKAYLASTQAAVSNGVTSAGTPGLTPGTITTGFVLSVLPTILDNSNILLQFDMTISSLDKLETFTSGDQSIEKPTVSNNQFMHRIGLRPGETIIVNALERTSENFDRSGLARWSGIGLGGSYEAAKTHETILVMITPTLLEGS